MQISRFLKAAFSGKTKWHFSQYGEDIVIHKLFPRSFKNGTYVDIGAFHPYYFSNTAYLWLKGWSGINVDANPHSIELFEKSRPRDTNVLGAVVSTKVATSQRSVPIFIPGKHIDTMGTCDEKTATERGYPKTIEVPALTIQNILDRLNGKEIDFLNIDIEGLDQVVLSELDFKRFRPKVICIEDYASDIPTVMKSETTTRMLSNGYDFKYRLGPSSVFQLCFS